jgi:hypothetical protein
VIDQECGVLLGRAAFSSRMDARKALLVTNGMVSMRPFVVFAIKVMGPGPRRLQMVKLAHDMNDRRVAPSVAQGRPSMAAARRQQPVAPGQRAA